MPEIKVTNHLYRNNRLLNTHAREDHWVGPKVVLFLTYDNYRLQLLLRKKEKEEWEAADVYHDDYVLICPFCKKNEEVRCEKAADYMDQLAEDALNHPSFRLIALFELEKKG